MNFGGGIFLMVSALKSKKKKSGSRKSDGSGSKVTFTPSSSSVTVLGGKSSVSMLDPERPLLDKRLD